MLLDLDIPFTIEDRRKKPEPNINLGARFEELGRELRFYQEEGAKRGHETTRGIVVVGTGGGKTMLVCDMLRRMSVAPALFIVPSKSLLYQTHEEFSNYLTIDGKPAPIGMIGDGVCKIEKQSINVCTYQTLLSAFNEVFKEKAGKTKGGVTYGAYSVINDELAGEKIKKTTDELLKEYKDCKFILKNALEKAEALRKPILEEINILKAESKALESQKDISPKNSRRIAAIAKKIEALIKSGKHKIMRATTKPRQNEAEKRQAYENRLKNIENKRAIRELVEECLAFILDEAHLAAAVTEAIGKHAKNAYYRVAVTATPYREDNQQLRVQGTFGKILIKISASDLIELGYLVEPYIFMVPIEHVEESDGYDDAYEKHIINCWERNYRIKQFAEDFFEQGLPTLILVERLSHGKILEKMIRNSVFVPGGENGEDDPTEEDRNYRKQMLAKTQRGEQILIATQWANVGVDAPALAALIIAGSGSSMGTTMQQVGRVLRLFGGKLYAIIIDFMSNQKHFHDHAVQREKAYKSERAFKYKRIRST